MVEPKSIAGSYRKDKSKLKPPNHHIKSIVPLVKETKLFLSSAVPAWAKEMYSKKTIIVQHNSYALEYIDQQTNEMCLIAVEQNGQGFRICQYASQ